MSKLIVNSLASLKKSHTEIKRAFEEDKYVSVTITSGKRSLDQNALQFHWYKELSEQGDMTMSEYRNYCKYHFGLHIMWGDDEELGNVWIKAMSLLSYQERLMLMESTSVTSTFNRKDMTSYLTEIVNHFIPEGFDLTNKEDYGSKL